MRVYRYPAGRKRKATKAARHELRGMVENKKVEGQSRELHEIEARKRVSYMRVGVYCVANPEAQHNKGYCPRSRRSVSLDRQRVAGVRTVSARAVKAKVLIFIAASEMS